MARRFLSLRRSLITSLLVIIVGPQALAHGHGDAGGRELPLSEAALHSFEAEVLGPAHAAEHAEQRRDERRSMHRWRTLSAEERRQEIRRERREANELARDSAARAPAKKIGRWTQAPFALPHFAIHSVLMPTGKLLFWGFPPDDLNSGDATIWDPAKGYGPNAFTEVPPPIIDPDGSGPQSQVIAPIYCSGQSLLASGEVLVAGGNLLFPYQPDVDGYTDWGGLNRVFTFDPWAQQWTEQPQMNDGRWYPTQVLLPDERTVFLGGHRSQAPGGVQTTDFEVFSAGPGTGDIGSIAMYEQASRQTEPYPHLFVLPNRKVLLAGPADTDSALLTSGPGDTFAWQNIPLANGYRIGGTAVLQPGAPSGSWNVTQIGGYAYTGKQPDGTQPPTETTEAINAKRPGKGWKLQKPLRIARSYHNTVLLPDDSMVTVGGGTGFTPEDGNYAIDSDGARRQVELYDPDNRKWKLGPAQLETRGYHSTALLLPDGRVFSGGDNAHPFEPDGSPSLTDTGEIYSPPYLFKGRRPKIRKAPDTVGFGKQVKIEVRRRPAATEAVLIAPSATTHANDMNQRLVHLKLREDSRTTLKVASPPNAGVAPPGYYMLFVLTEKGVPSVAEWIRLGDRG